MRQSFSRKHRQQQQPQQQPQQPARRQHFTVSQQRHYFFSFVHVLRGHYNTECTHVRRNECFSFCSTLATRISLSILCDGTKKNAHGAGHKENSDSVIVCLCHRRTRVQLAQNKKQGKKNDLKFRKSEDERTKDATKEHQYEQIKTNRDEI